MCMCVSESVGVDCPRPSVVRACRRSHTFGTSRYARCAAFASCPVSWKRPRPTLSLYYDKRRSGRLAIPKVSCHGAGRKRTRRKEKIHSPAHTLCCRPAAMSTEILAAWFSSPLGLASHALISSMLAGLIWTIQVVHYPQFADVGTAHFPRYEAEHTRRITMLVGPLMLAELTLAAGLCYAPPPPGLIAAPQWVPAAGFALLVIIWMSTALLQVPEHSTLSKGFDATAHGRLVNSNWIRTLGWSARAMLAMWMLLPPQPAEFGNS